ncbi:MAG: hypothetical protein ACFE9R_15445 [Candidatus Hermodarchaeota archaeon]
MSKKYSSEFTEFIEKFNELGSLEYISNEFLSLMRQKCFNCNRNRVECAFQPHCENRKYMNIMIHMKMNLNDIPSFCYSQQLRNLKDYLTGKAYLIEPIDYKVFLQDFLELLDIKFKSEQTKKNETILDEIIKKIRILKGNVHIIDKKQGNQPYFMFIADGIIYYIDFQRDIVTINLNNKIIETEDELSDLIKLYSKFFNINTEIIEEMAGWWYLKVTIPSKQLKSENILNEYIEKIQKFSGYSNFFSENGTIKFFIDLKTPKNQKWDILKFKVSNLLSIFKLLGDLSKKIAE